MHERRLPPKHLTSGGPAGTSKEGGAAVRPSTSAFSATPSEFVEALDSALGAVAGMFAIAALTPSAANRTRLDAHYETLITSVEVFRENVPKA